MIAQTVKPGALRLFLAAVVIFQHYGVGSLGTWAVYVFFILSGYWISAVWGDRYRFCSRPVLTFAISRYWRLLPIYLLCTCATLLVVIRFSARGGDALACLQSSGWLARSLFLVSSASQTQFLVPAWSLDIEMQFYLLVPVLASVWMMQTHRAKVILAVITLGSLSSWWLSDGWRIDRYAGFFLAGACIHQSRWQPSRGVAMGSALSVIAIVTIILSHPQWSSIFSDVANHGHAVGWRILNNRWSGGSAILVIPAIAWVLRQRSGGLDRHLGNLAYPVYLVHYVWILIIQNQVHRLDAFPDAAVFSGYLGAVALSGLGLYLLVDCPSEKRRHAWVAGRRSAPIDNSQPDPCRVPGHAT